MTLKKQRAFAGPSGDIEVCGEEILKKGNAVDAVIAGVFAACATSASVLLGPVQLLVGGGGAGLRAFDGRVRQPGLGAPRPRGFMPGEDVPNAARIGVPWLPATLSAALATAGSATLAQVMAPAIALAKGSGREEVLSRIAGRGPRALEERPISSALLGRAGRTEGGLLTLDDLASPRPEVVTASRLSLQGPPPDSMKAAAAAKAGENVRVLVTLPWAHVEDGAPVLPAGGGGAGPAATRAVLAVDRNGTFALACWDEAPDGMMIDDLDLRAPFAAEPVLRGKTRTKPGDVRAACAPIALVGSPAAPELALAAFGARDAYDVLEKALGGLVHDERLEGHGEARFVAVSHVKGVAAVLRS